MTCFPSCQEPALGIPLLRRSLRFGIRVEHAKKGPVELKVLENWGLLALQGPKVTSYLQALTSFDLQKLTFGTSAFVPIEGFNLHVACGGYTGEDGFEISIPPLQTLDVTKFLSKSPVQLTGLGTHDSLHLEAGCRESLLTALARSELKWLSAFIGSKSIVQGHPYISNPIHCLFCPHSHEKVVVGPTNSQPTSITAYGGACSYGLHDSSFNATEIGCSSITMRSSRCSTGTSASLASINRYLLKLVHLSNSFRMVKGTTPFQAGDVCGSESKTVSDVNTQRGNVKVKGHHNWKNAGSYPVTLMQDAPNAFAGVGIHCYKGQVANQDAFHNAFPSYSSPSRESVVYQLHQPQTEVTSHAFCKWLVCSVQYDIETIRVELR
ncbi:glycoside hydrolase family 30 protein [Collybiopsis luxurians FD-317 M1]|uniref:Glycoside hydrolase family 30 protein n=1 Tax=Collybiopsis luxurians FD-317 M1 TaxID=944289 RepID=A0A0D0BND5_9AGAR|nr:glycoside hydrolase family 30 protein [Collybiopsis luxurians FD-317 M1]